MITNRQIASIVVALLCAAALWIIPSQVEDGEPGFATGASLLPDVAVSLILIFALSDLVLSLARSRRSVNQHDAEGPEDVALGGAQFSGMLSVAGAMTLYALVLPVLGYLLSSTLLLAGLMVCTGGRRPVTLIAVTAGAVFVLYLGMTYGFRIHLQALPDLAAASTWLKG